MKAKQQPDNQNLKVVKPKVKKKIVETKNRGVLGEGRDNGMGFAFLQKMENGVYNTVQPMSPCKDYLAEVVLTEATGIPTKGCGLVYPKQLNIFEKGKAYLGIQMMERKGGGYRMNEEKSLEVDQKKLKKNYKNIQKLLNDIENQIGLSLTKIEAVNDNYFLVTHSSEWTKSSIAISLYTLLMRVALQSDGTKETMPFLEEVSKTAVGGDRDLMFGALPKLKLILKEKKLPPNRTSYSKNYLKSGMQSPHHNGIASWDSKFEEAELRD